MNQTPGTFSAWIDALDSSQRTGMIALFIVAVVAIIAIVTITVYKMHKNRLEDALKRELLDRGMTASEIVTVVRARPGKGRGADTPS